MRALILAIDVNNYASAVGQNSLKRSVQAALVFCIASTFTFVAIFKKPIAK
jgi:uncharacterized membrane-anchored protein YjiN (DUF445 family)